MSSHYVIAETHAAALKIARMEQRGSISKIYKTSTEAYEAWLNQPLPMQTKYGAFMVYLAKSYQGVVTPLNIEAEALAKRAG